MKPDKTVSATTQNDGSAAGQTVPNLHWHIIPRYDGDITDPTGGVRGVIPAERTY